MTHIIEYLTTKDLLFLNFGNNIDVYPLEILLLK